MNLTTNEAGQPEQKTNSEQNADSQQVSPSIVNALVGGSFVCQGCGHELINDFCMKTGGYCYLCDPNITLEELLK